MGQKLMRHTLPAEAACQDSTIDMGPDESVLILIKHCRDMKQQETRLRLITLLLLLSCMTLFLITTGADSRQHENSGSTGQGSADEPSPAYSKQETLCPADSPPANSKRLHINLRSVPTGNDNDKQYIKWDVEKHGEKYNQEKRAIVIPENGIYFVYVRIVLSSHCEEGDENFKIFSVKLHSWNEGYDQSIPLAEAKDGIMCTGTGARSVFVGQLFDLLEGDHLSVWIEKGYKMIEISQFGAYLT